MQKSMDFPYIFVHNNQSHQAYKKASQVQRSILPINNSTQKNRLIEDYLLHNLTNIQSFTLKSGVVSIEYMSHSNYIGEVSEAFPNQKQNTSEIQAKQNLNIVQKQGRGIYRYSNSDVYMGDWQGDVFHGIGMYIFSNGNIYRGLFHQGSSIKGTLNYANGEIYEGEFKDGLRHGQGVMKYAKRDLEQNESQVLVYTGKWERDKRNGKGVLESKGMIIEGVWEQDEINGEVNVKINETNSICLEYRGLMSHDEFVKGFLIVRYSENNYYEGEVYQGQFQGKGKYVEMIMIESQKYIRYEYEGQFKNGCMEGKGRLKTIRTDMMQHVNFISQYEGVFKTIDKNIPKFDQKGKIIYSNGDTYEGIFNLGLKQGKGIYKFQNGDIYEGEFKNDKIDGRGVYKWQNALTSYTGLFSNGRIVEGTGNFNKQQVIMNLNRNGFVSAQRVDLQNQKIYQAQRILFPEIQRPALLVNRENPLLMKKSHRYINVMCHQLNNLNKI